MQGNLNQFHQHVTCATRGKKILDHLYSTHRDAFKALPHPPFSKSDHNYILLIPAYKQKLKQEGPVPRSIEKWKWSDATLQDCFASTDWNMFRDSSNGIQEYTTSVIYFINKCIDDVVPTVTVCTYHNQKPWITGNIHTELKARAATFKERESNPEAYKESRYALRRTTKLVNVNTGLRSYRTTSALTLVRCGRACKPLQTTKESTELPSDTSLPDKLHYFYARFEAKKH